MGYIAVTPEELHSQSAQVAAGAEEVNQLVTRLMNQIQELAGNWQGAGSSAFQQLFDEWRQGAQMTKAGMDGIAQFLNNAAQAYEDTDTRISSAAKQ